MASLRRYATHATVYWAFVITGVLLGSALQEESIGTLPTKLQHQEAP